MAGRLLCPLICLTLVAPIAALVACSNSEGPQARTRSDGVDGPVIAAVEDQDAYMDAAVRGPLRHVDGCLLLGDTVVVWPHETSWDEKRQAVVFAADFEGYADAEVGEDFRGAGGYVVEPRELSSEGVDATRRCWKTTETRGVVVARPE